MRILTYTSLFPNSQKPLQGIFVLQRIGHLARLPGNRVCVVAPVPYFPRWLQGTRWQKEGQVPSHEVIDGLTVFHPRYPLLPKVSMPFHGLLMFLGSLLLVRRLHREWKFDCIDAHFVYPDGFAAVLLGRILGLPVAVSARGSDINFYPGFRTIRPLIRWTLHRAAGLIAVSTSLAEGMIRLGSRRSYVCVIGNGIDPTRFYPVDVGEARACLGLEPGQRLVLSVAALVPAKGLHFLIPAFAQVLSKFRDLRLYILGEGKERKRLESLISTYGLESSVFLQGSVPNDQLRYWYGAAELTCLVSSREGWPNVLQESLACGTPVLATRVWGTPEIVVSPVLGVLVDQDVAQIASALEQSLRKQWDRRAIAEHAANRTWHATATEASNFLHSIVRRFSSREQQLHAERSARDV
jgi:teichuronic acid biosynthesis glycosyltransferase TuaC